MEKYEVRTAGWLRDGHGEGKFRMVGDIIELPLETAEWLLRSRQISRQKTSQPAAEPNSDPAPPMKQKKV